VTAELEAVINQRKDGSLVNEERKVLDAAMKVAAERKAKILARRAKEPDVEDMEVTPMMRQTLNG
jgi:hypothetical protein